MNAGPYATRGPEEPPITRFILLIFVKSHLLLLHMFSIRHRYIFITLIAAYSFGNILLAGGDRPVDETVNDGLLFIAISIQIFVMWEFNRGIEWAQKASLSWLPSVCGG